MSPARDGAGENRKAQSQDRGHLGPRKPEMGWIQGPAEMERERERHSACRGELGVQWVGSGVGRAGWGKDEELMSSGSGVGREAWSQGQE